MNKDVKKLIRMGIRTFYDPIHAVLVDTLLRNIKFAITDEDLAKYHRLNLRDIRRALEQMRHDELIGGTTSEVRVEGGGGRSKTPKTYYYVQAGHFVKVFRQKLQKVVAGEDSDAPIGLFTHELTCRACGHKMNDHDIIHHFGTGGVVCPKCGGAMDEKAPSTAPRNDFEQMLEKLITLLRNIQEEVPQYVRSFGELDPVEWTFRQRPQQSRKAGASAEVIEDHGSKAAYYYAGIRGINLEIEVVMAEVRPQGCMCATPAISVQTATDGTHKSRRARKELPPWLVPNWKIEEDRLAELTRAATAEAEAARREAVSESTREEEEYVDESALLRARKRAKGSARCLLHDPEVLAAYNNHLIDRLRHDMHLDSVDLHSVMDNESYV